LICSFQSLVTSYWLLVAGRYYSKLRIAYCQLPIVYCQLISCWLLVAGRYYSKLRIVYCQLPIAYCLLSIAYCQLTNCWLLFIYSILPVCDSQYSRNNDVFTVVVGSFLLMANG